MSQELVPPVWIDTPRAMQLMLAAISRQPRLAVDTEANSLYAYRDRVCLIQFSTPDMDYLVDPFAFDDLNHLALIFADPQVEKIFHAAEYDVYGLVRDYGFTFCNIFDTMVAARTLGYKAIGLDHLLGEKFGLILNKRYQKADWGKRPLSDEMLNYARLDTHYLLPLRDIMEGELAVKGCLALAQEDFARLCHPNGNNEKAHRPHWGRVSGQQDLTPRQLTILNQLCLSREMVAEQLDRPVFKVLSDGLLVKLAQNDPHDNRDLTTIGMTERQIDKFGKIVLRAIRQGESAPLVQRAHPTRPSNAMLNRLDRLKSWRKRTARQIGVESDVVLPRLHMQNIAERNPRNAEELHEIMKDIPWRAEHFGADILKAIS
jgi:ribonuclease D